MDSNLNLDILPPEVVTQFLLRLSLKDLANYCQTYKAASEYCKDNAFWKDKYRYDFGPLMPTLTSGEKWIDIYKQRKMVRNTPLSVGKNHYAVIDDQGILYMAGENSNGQLGDGTQKDAKIPIMIRSFTKKVISVSCGNYFTIAITEDGKTYGWGWNNFIDSQEEYFLVPTLIPNLKNQKAIKVSCNENGWGVILDDGSVYFSINIFFDRNIDEYRGITRGYHRITDRISSEDEIINISVYSDNFAVVTKSGKVYFVGSDIGGTEDFPAYIIGIEIDENGKTIKPEHIFFPSKQGIIPRIKQVSVGSNQIMVLTEDGDVLIWNGGYNGLWYGVDDLEEPAEPGESYPHPWRFASLPKISYISPIVYDSYAAITTDGRLYFSGQNKITHIISNFQEGDERFYNNEGRRSARVPVEMDIGSKVNYIALGESFTIASTADGMVNYIDYSGDNPI